MLTFFRDMVVFQVNCCPCNNHLSGFLTIDFSNKNIKFSSGYEFEINYLKALAAILADNWWRSESIQTVSLYSGEVGGCWSR